MAIAQLTQRQQEVFELCRLGLSSREIAIRIGRSPRTVESHIVEILNRLGLENKRDLIGYKVQPENIIAVLTVKSSNDVSIAFGGV